MWPGVLAGLIFLVACADRRPLALLPLEAQGVSPDVVSAVEGALERALGSRRAVKGPGAVRRELGPACGAKDCTEETARALHVAEVVSGNIALRGGVYRLSLAMKDARGHYLTREIEGPSAEDLLRILAGADPFQNQKSL